MTSLRRIGDYNFIANIIKATEAEEFSPIADHLEFYQELKKWVEDDTNVALTDGENAILFERVFGEVSYEVHLMFRKELRGKYALDTTKEAFKYMMEGYGAESFIGIVPKGHHSAKLFCRLLGCKSLGMVDRPTGTFEMFQYLKREHEVKGKGESKCLQQ